MVKKSKLQLKKVQFTNEITPILNTLDFEYEDPNTDSMYRKELYGYINGKYYYIKKDYAESYDKTTNILNIVFVGKTRHTLHIIHITMVLLKNVF
jgi:hypothetical protein